MKHLLLSFVLSGACTQPKDESCQLKSSVEDFQPDCHSAELVHLTGESRIAIPGGDYTLVAYLPETLNETVYGGTSGNPLILLLEGEETDSAKTRTSTITFDSLESDSALVVISADFGAGEVNGPITLTVRWDGDSG